MNSYFDAFSFLFKNNASNKKTCFFLKTKYNNKKIKIHL
jgi:hypothetical protein